MSAAAETVRVDLGARGYDIVVGSGVLDEAGARIAPLLKRRRVFVLTDENVARAQRPRVEKSLSASGVEAHWIVVPAGEGSKELGRLGGVLDTMIEQRLERSDVLVAMGGGVIGDLGGLAASLALRGIPYVQIPTTLLAQVDSAVGGKTGINTKAGKNLVGAFHQPKLVLADTDTLSTLPRREIGRAHV